MSAIGPDLPSYVSRPAAPYERGTTFGRAHRRQVQDTVDRYHALFEQAAGGRVDYADYAAGCLRAIDGWAPRLGAEIRGIAEGAGIPLPLVVAVNARTEILARAGGARRGECTAVVATRPAAVAAVGIQHWDWYPDLRESCFQWTIQHDDGSATQTMTEYGIVGKIGLGRRGFGLLFTILHHSADGVAPAVPVHVVARRILDDARNVADAVTIAARVPTGASSSMTFLGHEDGEDIAVSCEKSPSGTGFVLPDSHGLIVRTNHFLEPLSAGRDVGVAEYPDSLLRRHLVGRRLRRELEAGPVSIEGLRRSLTSHAGGPWATCCHADPDDEPLDRFETLAAVVIDPVHGTLDVRAAGSCSHLEP